MNRSTKVSLVGSIFVITGLCGSLSYAAQETDNTSKYFALNANNQYIAMNSTRDSRRYAYPSITSKVFSGNKKTNIQSFANISRQPLQGVLVADFAHVTFNKFQKKNSIFEFAAKFNDKLQQILAIFDFSSKKPVTRKENINQKSQHSAVNLSSNIANCISSKK